MRRPAALLAFLLLYGAAHGAQADWDDQPGVGYDPTSTEAARCGTSTPPRGHFPADLDIAGHPDGITLTVRQDKDRLCYVTGDRAEAPTLRVRQGSTMVVTLRNEITDPKAIDDYVGVAKLGAPNEAVPTAAGFYKVNPGHRHHATGETNLHVHGFAVPPVVPQDEVLMSCADPAVGEPVCGHRELTYRYQIPADMPAGLYWYHPHVHGEVQAQMLMGLVGAIVVEGPEDDARRAAGIEDRVFIISQAQDVDAAANAGDAEPVAVPKAATETAKPPQPDPALGGAVDTAHEIACSANTEADEISLNGSKVFDGKVPDSEMAPLEIKEGTRQLWRVLNAATDAFLNLTLLDEAGNPLPIEIVARDGAPLTDDAGKRLHLPPTTEPQLVPPAGRLEFLVTAPPAGRKAYFITRAVDTGCAGDKVPERRLAVLKSMPGGAETGAGARAAPPAPSVISTAADFFSGLLAKPVDRKRVIAFAEYPRPGSQDLNDFYIMERKPGAELKPYEMGGPPLITVKAGTTEEWTVENWTNELHAFHMHQVHFRVLEEDGRKLAFPPLLDTVNVPYAHVIDGKLVPGRVRVKMSFPAELAGDIPFHCHLVDHEDAGMMAVLRVEPAASAVPTRKAELLPGFAPPGQTAICRTPRPS